jgi:3-oxoacyl-[acyl-carrier protein] reductase
MKTALITGGSTGIGKFCCIKLAKAGFNIVINHINNETIANEVKIEVEKYTNCITVNADVTKEIEVQLMQDRIKDKFGFINVLVNNAGAYPRKNFNDLTINFWNEMIETNLTSHFICSQVFSKEMIANESGSIINIGSILSKIGRKDLLPYISAKSGLEGLTKALAIELGRFNIRCNCVLPGSIEVEKEKEVIENISELYKRQINRQCLKRRGSPSDVANLVAFLASDQSTFITGQSIAVDGGWFYNDK